MISVDQAIEHLLAASKAMPDKPVALSKALGSVLAADVVAKVTLPPRAASARDGYAVRLDDVRTKGAQLHVIGEAPAGRPFDGEIGKGQAVRIFTGGVVPDGADHVLIQENAERGENSITVTEASGEARHIRKAGIDFHQGDILIKKGTRLEPGHLALAAAGNHAKLDIFQKPRIGLIANGDELRRPGETQDPDIIVSSNPSGLGALIESWGGDPVDLGIAGDTPDAIAALIEQAHHCDIIVPIGGASVGDHDHMRDVFSSRGLEMIFEKIAVRPGKPTWFGKMGDQLVLGLPGNPASATVCAYLFLQTLITGQSALQGVAARLKIALGSNGPRETYARARISCDESGQLRVMPFPRQDSSLLTPFPQSNALIRIHANQPGKPAGDIVDCILLGSGPGFTDPDPAP